MQQASAAKLQSSRQRQCQQIHYHYPSYCCGVATYLCMIFAKRMPHASFTLKCCTKCDHLMPAGCACALFRRADISFQTCFVPICCFFFFFSFNVAEVSATSGGVNNTTLLVYLIAALSDFSLVETQVVSVTTRNSKFSQVSYHMIFGIQEPSFCGLACSSILPISHCCVGPTNCSISYSCDASQYITLPQLFVYQN